MMNDFLNWLTSANAEKGMKTPPPPKKRTKKEDEEETDNVDALIEKFLGEEKKNAVQTE